MHSPLTSRFVVGILAGLTGAAAFASVGCSSSDPASDPYTQAPRADGGGTTPTPNPTPGKDAGSTTTPDAGSTTVDAGPPVTANETWADGKQITGAVTIAAGATVVIAPGATITVTGNATITVAGTLSSPGGSTAHAKITGTAWGGIAVASGGTLDLTNVDLENATPAIATLAGNAAAKYQQGTIATAAGSVPLKMDAGSTLSLVHAKVTGGQSVIKGTFSASYLDYDKGSSEGLVIDDAAGSMTIEDSTLHGSGGGDYVVSSAAKSLTVSYTTISGSHCGFHFGAVSAFDISYVTDDSNSWGAMLYGWGGAGPYKISYSNFDNTSYNLDGQSMSGVALMLDHVYTNQKDSYAQGGPTITAAQTSPITTAKPR